MSLQKQHIAKLAEKWENRTITEAEEIELNAWYQEHQDDPVNLPSDFVSSEEAHESRIWKSIQKQIGHQPSIIPFWNRYWVRSVGVAAAILFVLSAGIFLYTDRNENIEVTAVNTDVIPGKVDATLTLANGKKIKLSDATNGKLADEAGVVITKSQDGELVYEIKSDAGEADKINTLTTSNGQTYKIRLPDGSFVWLNAASSISYSVNLIANGRRNVTLDGEAYFEVAKDEKHPFVVQTEQQDVEVLGTHFNVNAYRDESAVKTTLLEGRVQVSTPQILNRKQPVVTLFPGQQSVVKNGKLTVGIADVEMETAWKNGQFIFDGQDFESLMNTISRWYDVAIVYDYRPANLHLGGKISKYKSIKDVLEILEGTGDVKFKIVGRRINVIR